MRFKMSHRTNVKPVEFQALFDEYNSKLLPEFNLPLITDFRKKYDYEFSTTMADDMVIILREHETVSGKEEFLDWG